MIAKSSKTPWLRLVVAACLVLALALGAVQTARAAEFIGGDSSSIPADQTIDDDVFIGGNTVVVDGTVNGDLFAGGTNLVINGVVKGSVFAGGQTVILNGKVEGSVYAGGTTVTVGDSASIGRNLFIGAYGLESKPGSVVERDTYIGAYQAVMNGEIGRDLMAGLAALEIGGKVGGDVVADVEAPNAQSDMPPMMFGANLPPPIPPGLRVKESASIGGKLTYTSPAEQANSIQGAAEGGVVYQTPVPEQVEPAVRPEARYDSPIWILLQRMFDRLREFITLLVLGALAAWLIPALLSRWAAQAQAAPLPSLGWGLVTWIVGYVGAFLVALVVIAVAILFGVITLGGLAGTVTGVGFSTLGLAFVVFSLMVSYGSKLVVSLLVGKLVLQRLAPAQAEHRFWPLLVGILIYAVLRLIPILDWIVAVIVTLVGLGAIWMVLREQRLPRLQAAAAD